MKSNSLLKHFIFMVFLFSFGLAHTYGVKRTPLQERLDNQGKTIAPLILDYETDQTKLNALKDLVNLQIALGKTLSTSAFQPIIHIVLHHFHADYISSMNASRGSIYTNTGYLVNPINRQSVDIFLRWVYQNRFNPHLIDPFPFDLKGSLYAIATALGRRPLIRENLIVHARKIYKIPRLVGQLTNLTYVNLADNLVCTIPREVGRLNKLKTLDMSFNLIGTLPKELDHLANLQDLNLSGNILCTIPSEIKGYKRLRSLNVSSNFLDELPEELGMLDDLKTCSVELNHIPKTDFGRIRAMFTPDVHITLQSQPRLYETGTKGTPAALEDNRPRPRMNLLDIGTINFSAWLNLF